jgi:hypothetical protein
VSWDARAQQACKLRIALQRSAAWPLRTPRAAHGCPVELFGGAWLHNACDALHRSVRYD